VLGDYQGGWEVKEPRINVYSCAAGHLTVTVDVDEGVTPFMMGCKTPGCNHDTTSSFYPRGPKPPHIPEPQWEWFKPTAKQLRKMDEGMRQHCEMGGLDLRARTDREPVYHE
jgi:hypothetical protein